MFVASTANGFRAVVRALRSLDGRGCDFSHLHAPGGPLCSAPVENLGKGMPETVVWEELEALDIHFRAVMQLRLGRRDQDPAKERPFNPHFIVSVAQEPEVSSVRSITELFGLRVSVESYVTPKVPCNANAASASDKRSVTADSRPAGVVFRLRVSTQS